MIMEIDRKSVNERLKIENEKPYGRQRRLISEDSSRNISSNQSINRNNPPSPQRNPNYQNSEICDYCKTCLNFLLSHPCILSLIKSKNPAEESYNFLSIKLIYTESLLFAYSKAYEEQDKEIKDLKNTLDLVMNSINELNQKKENQTGYSTVPAMNNYRLNPDQNQLQNEIMSLKEIIRINMKIILEKDMMIDKLKKDLMNSNMIFFKKDVMKHGEYENFASKLSSFTKTTSDMMYFRSALEEIARKSKN
ncbi:hypothetical protein SteCoe_28280 [Stentor coeruleus]|uniref:Uncharacterized protein n=1 Tax=Stentor coeruleus TaxID=5963 RepID=A0A1R2B8N1_9CILI|nr:hypothetical protein SteCoe_28280 [Stentor coeruleus]